MADEFRKGAKDVHFQAILGGVPFDHRPCSFDEGGTWGPVIPAGRRCPVCFAAYHELRQRRGSRGRTRAATAGTAAALALAAVVFASSLDTPVNILGPYATASGTAAVSPVVPFATVTPGPVPPSAPALTPPPTIAPQPLPTFGPVPTYPPVPTFGPLPTWPPLPTLVPLPDPTLRPVPCVHPGQHLGSDTCKWPGNR